MSVNVSANGGDRLVELRLATEWAIRAEIAELEQRLTVLRNMVVNGVTTTTVAMDAAKSAVSASVVKKRGRGRPPGAKNKNKNSGKSKSSKK